MGVSVTELFKQVLDLDEKDRAALAGLLLSSLDPAPDEGREAAWQAEIVRRAAELDAGSVETISWIELKARLETKLNGR
jgi:putative addiction module component (TIGR02574 family)